MPWLAEWMLPLVVKGGLMLAMKGPKVDREMIGAAKAIRMLGGGQVQIFPADLRGQDGHVIVKIRKIARADPRYPRPAPAAKGKAI
jgi:16S rRNA (guanine527-N7)-methyltransferase